MTTLPVLPVFFCRTRPLRLTLDKQPYILLKRSSRSPEGYILLILGYDHNAMEVGTYQKKLLSCILLPIRHNQ